MSIPTRSYNMHLPFFPLDPLQIDGLNSILKCSGHFHEFNMHEVRALQEPKFVKERSLLLASVPFTFSLLLPPIEALFGNWMIPICSRDGPWCGLGGLVRES